MIARLARYLVLVAVVVGILSPLSSAALAKIGIIDHQVIVICTGHGLRTITVDQDGAPITASQDSDHCALVHAVDISVAIRPVLYAQRLGAAPPVTPYRQLHRTKNCCASYFSRAPPWA
ncbi:hypothetical protein O4H61_08800 [Roseovarius aestuarii]|nr:hypothetical protein [Roseovarius aestuarii]